MPELPQAVVKPDSPSGKTVNEDRTAATDRARREWISRLIDLSRRNRLLFFRDLKTGTLDLTKAGASLAPVLIRSEAVRIADLLPEEEQQSGVARLLEIHRKAMENLEEKGLDTMYLAMGMATWASSDGGRPPSAPVLLCPITVEIRGREPRSSSIKRAGDIEINPVL
ncbi:MAG TPA: DUF4011 domain-containing protein, partial [Candidatus Eisenbacteria bacterium]|nr:DUF4011 domain-containing protein [Candidatus Eisenbacteria bacterium]